MRSASLRAQHEPERAGRLPSWLHDLLEKTDEEMVLRGFTGETRRLYLAHIRRFYEFWMAGGWRPGSPDRKPEVDDRAVRDWLLTILRAKHSHSYASQALSSLRFLFRRVLDAPAPVADIPRPRRRMAPPRVLSRTEIRSFLGALKTPKHRAIATVLYSGGLRVSEAARLRVEDIETHRGRIRIRQGKRREDRYVMLSPVALEVLKEYARGEQPKYWLFPAGHRRDRHITVRAIQREVARAGKAAGIKGGVTPHMLRHSFATHLLEAGTDLCYIQKLLGHVNISTTVTYTRVARQEARKVRSPIDRIFEEEEDRSQGPTSDHSPCMPGEVIPCLASVGSPVNIE